MACDREFLDLIWNAFIKLYTNWNENSNSNSNGTIKALAYQANATAHNERETNTKSIRTSSEREMFLVA